MRQLSKLNGLKVTILGLGRFEGGVAATRFLAEQGAIVTVTDSRSETELEKSLDAIRDVPVDRLLLNGHPPEAFNDCQLLVVNPAIPVTSPLVQDAITSGIPTTSEIELFLQRCQAPIIAVTGSNGKSTTAALIHHLLQAATTGRCWLGGNIGTSLLSQLDHITEDDKVVLELSSFQLEYLRDSGFAPHIAVVTNLTPNHLNWHGKMTSYAAAKQVIFSRQSRTQIAIVPETHNVNHEADHEAPTWRIRCECLRFGTADQGENGVFFAEGHLIFRRGAFEDAFRCPPPSLLPGEHNMHNIAAAACAAWMAGLSLDDIPNLLRAFPGLPHRLQVVDRYGPWTFIDDSVATTPESAIAALHTYPAAVIIAGGSDKGSDLTLMAKMIHQQAVGAVLVGETAKRIRLHLQELRAENCGPSVVVSTDFSSVVDQAVALLPEGGIVLLSPGCASYGWFRDYRDRGEQFRILVRRWIESQ